MILEIIPNYVKNFKCIGSDCEHNCCQDWNINIDVDSYKFYKDNPIEGIIFSENIVKKENEYIIKLNKYGVCPYKDKDELCLIHKTFGEDHLSNTCKSYPRIVVPYSDKIKRSLVLSCPEAVRQVLLDPEAFILNIKDGNFKGFIYRKVDSDESAIYNFLLKIILNDDFNIDEKLFFFGISIDLISSSNKDLVDILDYCINNIDNGSFGKLCSEINGNPSIYYQMIIRLFNTKLYLTKYSKSTEIYNSITNIYNKISDNNQSFESFRYSQYLDFINNNKYVFNNLLLYKLYHGDFSIKNIKDEYELLLIDYLFVRGFLIIDSDFSIENLVKNIYLHHRITSHSKAYKMIKKHIATEASKNIKLYSLLKIQ